MYLLKSKLIFYKHFSTGFCFFVDFTQFQVSIKLNFDYALKKKNVHKIKYDEQITIMTITDYSGTTF